MRFRNRVREVRLLRGLSVVALAKRAGVSKQTIFTLEGNEFYEARGAVQRKLCAALNETMLFWMEREAGDPPPPDEGVQS